MKGKGYCVIISQGLVHTVSLTIFIAGAGLGNVYFLEYTFVENPVNIWWMSYFTHNVVDVVYTIIYKLKCTKDHVYSG